MPAGTNITGTDTKSVNISVSGTTITVVVAFGSFSSDYHPLVTLMLQPDGTPEALEGTRSNGTFTFVKKNAEPGHYVVNVYCSGKTFGDVVEVPTPVTAAKRTVKFSYEHEK